jgi:hypothetical protein
MDRIRPRHHYPDAISTRRDASVQHDVSVRAATDPSRVMYLVDEELSDRVVAAEVFGTILKLLRPHLGRVVVDAFVHDEPNLPPQVRVARDVIRDVGAARRSGGRWHVARGADPGAAVELDPHDDQHWRALVVYAAWSINVELFAPGRRLVDLGGLHDGVHASAALTPEERDTLTSRLGGIALITLEEHSARRRTDQRQASTGHHRERRVPSAALQAPRRAQQEHLARFRSEFNRWWEGGDTLTPTGEWDFLADAGYRDWSRGNIDAAVTAIRNRAAHDLGMHGDVPLTQLREFLTDQLLRDPPPDPSVLPHEEPDPRASQSVHPRRPPTREPNPKKPSNEPT